MYILYRHEAASNRRDAIKQFLTKDGSWLNFKDATDQGILIFYTEDDMQSSAESWSQRFGGKYFVLTLLVGPWEVASTPEATVHPGMSGYPGNQWSE